MNTASRQLLDSFDQLPDADKQEVAAEILRRTLSRGRPPLSDEELVLSAEDLFLELDCREAEGEPKP